MNGRLWWYVIGYTIGFLGAAMLVSLTPVPVPSRIAAWLLVAGSILLGIVAWASDQKSQERNR